MSLLETRESRLYSKVTREKVFDMCCDSAGIPVRVDDPHSKINKLLVDLYNGKKGATMGEGTRTLPYINSDCWSRFFTRRLRKVNSFAYNMFTTSITAITIILCVGMHPNVS